MITTEKEGRFYTDILRKVKAHPAPKELTDNTARIRRTRKDYNLQKNIEVSLSEQATVCVSRPSAVIECKNLDEVTTIWKFAQHSEISGNCKGRRKSLKRT